MTQAQVDFQKLLNLEQKRHLEEEEEEKEEKIEIENIPFPLEKTMSELQDELNQDIFSDDKAIKNYSSTKIKARNFLTNVSYNRITTVDYKNKNFVIDCFTFLILYLNPFYLERKFESDVEREFVNTLWMFLMPNNLYNYISRNENMATLNKIKIKYHDAKKIILEFLQYDQGNLKVLSDYLEKNGILYQFLYGNLFPKCFSRISDYGVRAKTLFNTYYQNLNIQRNIISWQNNNLQIKQEIEEEEEVKVKQEEKYDNASPINMTTLNDENIKIKEEKPKKNKRKINNTETKEKKRELKKQKLLQQLNENTEKLKKLKKKKIN